MCVLPGAFKVHESKVFSHNGYLWGAAGECPNDADLKSWFFGKGKRRVLDGMDFDMMVVAPNGRIEIWNETAVCDIVKLPFYAIGSGAGVCMGAMAAGATAEEAVAFAILYAEGCDGKVTSVKIKSQK